MKLPNLSPRVSLTLTSCALLIACGPKAGSVGAIETADTENAEDTEDTEDASEPGDTEDTEGPELPPPSCPPSELDTDIDNVSDADDNAPDRFNPGQSDIDGDGIGDVIDLCPTVAGATDDATDSDHDGVGDECDTCRQSLSQYNEHATMLGVPAYMRARNIPDQADLDGDGIGDACDNCVAVANCQDFGPDNPYQVGGAIAFDDETVCQRDDDANMVGDACEGATVTAFAAGPIGLGPSDDFDQDGIANVSDACPRQPLADTIACTTNQDCPENRACEPYEGQNQGICDHTDTDADEVGDICDTCPTSPNPMQVIEGGAQQDDPDGDFVGGQCETSPQCADVERDPLPLGFHQVAASGRCCTVELAEDEASGDLFRVYGGSPLLAPHPEDPSLFVPVRLDCSQDQQDAFECHRLPTPVAQTPGILTPPPGCDALLSAAGITAEDNRADPLWLHDFDGDDHAMWDKACLLPQSDQDLDGLGDACDLCPHAFDPDNAPYIDPNGRVWPSDGAMCNGAYAQSCAR